MAANTSLLFIEIQWNGLNVTTLPKYIAFRDILKTISQNSTNLDAEYFWVKIQIFCKEMINTKIKKMTSFTGYQFQPSLTLLGERGFILFFWQMMIKEPLYRKNNKEIVHITKVWLL